MEEEEAGRRMERGDEQLARTTGSRRVTAIVGASGGGEIEIQMEAATAVGSGASAAAASTSSGQEGDAEEGLQQVRSLRFSIFFSASSSYLCRCGCIIA